MFKLRFSLLTIILLLILPCSLSFAGGGHDHGHGHGGHDEHEEDKAEGPNGGRLLKKDDFALEITIFEDGVPPHYRVYGYFNEKSIPASDLKVSINLERFLRESKTYELKAQSEYLISEEEIYEPHSFDVKVSANYKGKDYHWEYESYEGQTELSDKALKVADLTIEKASSAEIKSTTEVFGRLLPNEDKVAHIYPRFPGLIKEIKKKLGDKVEKGELVAVIESNQSLQAYEIRSLISGTVIKRHATLGEYAPEGKELFVIADLSEVWADFQVYRDDFPTIAPEQEISIQLNENQTPLKAKVNYVSPVTDIATQSKLIRAVISNADQSLRPGLFISGVLSSESLPVAVAVKREAIQKFRDWDVVFITDGHKFQAMPVVLGRQDQEFVEILSGLNAGELYVSNNSFIVKSHIEKSGASHDH